MQGWWHEQRVRERAYEVWQQAGCPDGRSVQHGLQAEAEVIAGEQEIALESQGAT